MTGDAIECAIIAHHEWVTRFRAVHDGVLTQPIDPESIRNDETCAFGEWMRANVDCFDNPVSFERVMAMHRAFHEVAATIATKMEARESHRTIDAYMVAFEDLSKQLVSYLRHIKGTTPA